jgi:predicted ATPase
MQIKSIAIKNFKACHNLEIETGRINVIIGSNGSGKSTLLEAIGILSAAITDRVNNTTLSNKGIRLSTSNLYQSGFINTNGRRSSTMDFEIMWQDDQVDSSATFTYRAHLNPPKEENAWRYHSEVLLEGEKKIHGRSGASSVEYNPYVGSLMLIHSAEIQRIRSSLMKIQKYGIYQPNTPTLRGTTQDQYQTEPIGLCGGRLAEAIDDILSAGNGEKFGPLWIDDVLELIDWAKQIRITTPNKSNINASVSAARRVIEFSDRYLRTDKRFTAYDASEGALYVLLLLSLAIHEKSPTVFAIDNFDHAMNPRLAKVATRIFSDLVLNTEKTVFLTTHNPLVLDGLDIQNDDIRLFTMDRNKDGHAKIRRVKVEQSLIDENQPLSRLWVNGRLGGMPELI